MLTSFTTRPNNTTESTFVLLDRVRNEVDLRKLVAPRLEDARDFGRYIRARCLSPDHKDEQPSALYFQDGVYCTACGWKAGAADIYRMFNPGLSVRDACLSLLSGDYKLTAAPEAVIRRHRELDADQALRDHFALSADQDALSRVTAMGFTTSAIRHFRLGLSRVRVRVDDGAFQWQKRLSVPVFEGARLVQALYRKLYDDAGPKIQMEAGAGAHLFNANVLANADMVVFAEGWGDVIVLWQVGIPAVTSTNGAGHWNDAWAERLSRVPRLYVVGDADSAGQRMMRRVIKRIPWAREIALPFIDDTKGDLRDLYLAGWRRSDFLRLLREADFRSAWRVIVERGTQ